MLFRSDVIFESIFADLCSGDTMLSGYCNVVRRSGGSDPCGYSFNHLCRGSASHCGERIEDLGGGAEDSCEDCFANRCGGCGVLYYGCFVNCCDGRSDLCGVCFVLFCGDACDVCWEGRLIDFCSSSAVCTKWTVISRVGGTDLCGDCFAYSCKSSALYCGHCFRDCRGGNVVMCIDCFDDYGDGIGKPCGVGFVSLCGLNAFVRGVWSIDCRGGVCDVIFESIFADFCSGDTMLSGYCNVVRRSGGSDPCGYSFNHLCRGSAPHCGERIEDLGGGAEDSCEDCFANRCGG